MKNIKKIITSAIAGIMAAAALATTAGAAEYFNNDGSYWFDGTYDGKVYVEDAYGSSVTVYFTLNVGSLSSYPEGAEIINGVRSNRVAISAAKDESKTLSVVTNASSGAQLTYKWTEGPLGDSSWWPLEEGMTDNAKNLTITVTESKRYLCVVTDQYGNQALNYFYVNIGGMKLSSNIGKPSLTGDNRYELDVPVKVGQKLTLKTIVDSSSSEISYTWKSLYEGWAADMFKGRYLFELEEFVFVR